MGYAARWMGYNPVYTDCINQKQQLTHDLKEVDMAEFKCDTRNRMNFYTEGNSLCLLFYTDCIIIVRTHIISSVKNIIIPLFNT